MLKDAEERKKAYFSNFVSKQSYDELLAQYKEGKTIEEFEKFDMKFTKVILNVKGEINIYAKVIHPWGKTFYFKDNYCVSQEVFTNATSVY